MLNLQGHTAWTRQDIITINPKKYTKTRSHVQYKRPTNLQAVI